MVGLEPSWPGTILSIDLASPGPLLHPASALLPEEAKGTLAFPPPGTSFFPWN